MHARIYGVNPEWNPRTTVEACPDYAWVIRGKLSLFCYLGTLCYTAEIS